MNRLEPIIVTDVDLAFGGDMSLLLPPYESIPDQFKSTSDIHYKFAFEWYYNGPTNLSIMTLDGVDPILAIRHISAVIVSAALKQEHKLAGVAFLSSQFFEHVEVQI